MSPPELLTRRERKRHQTLAHLVATALRLFETHGYDAVTMEQIAGEADVAKRTLYNHFPVKEAILAHWIHAQLEADLGRLSAEMDRYPTFPSRVSAILDVSAAWCERHRAYMPPYLRYRFMSIESGVRGGGRDGSPDIAKVYASLIEAAQRSGELRKDVAASHLAILFHHLYLGALMRWLSIPGLALRQEFRVAIDLFLNGAKQP